MASEAPIPLERLANVLILAEDAAVTRDDILGALAELRQEYAERGIELVEVAGGYRFQTKALYADWINRLWEERRPRYSRALLETLAIVAYRQPITRAEIEAIRGVAVSTGIIKTLQDREWVKVVGHRDVPGKPAIYATTRQFLEYFGLASLNALPTLAELKDFDALNADLFADTGVSEADEIAVGADADTDPDTDTSDAAPEHTEAPVATAPELDLAPRAIDDDATAATDENS